MWGAYLNIGDFAHRCIAKREAYLSVMLWKERVDYFNGWESQDEHDLQRLLKQCPAQFILSPAKETNRNSMVEALVINFSPQHTQQYQEVTHEQLLLLEKNWLTVEMALTSPLRCSFKSNPVVESMPISDTPEIPSGNEQRRKESYSSLFFALTENERGIIVEMITLHNKTSNKRFYNFPNLICEHYDNDRTYVIALSVPP